MKKQRRGHSPRHSLCFLAGLVSAIKRWSLLSLSSMAAEDDDWRSDIFDAEGNYLQQDSTYDFPEELSRGSARQRLNMQHGFMRHIVSSQRLHMPMSTADLIFKFRPNFQIQEHNQLARQQYEAQNPSNTMQQRYLAKPSE